jgi:sulfur carrier protein
MKLTVAGAVKEYGEGLTVTELLEAEKVQTPMYVTVSVNDEFVKSEALGGTVRRDGDGGEGL